MNKAQQSGRNLASARDPVTVVLPPAMLLIAGIALVFEVGYTGYVACLSLCSAGTLWMLYRAVRQLGGTSEVGFALFPFAVFFWFHVSALQTGFAGEPFRERAAFIDIDLSSYRLALFAVQLFYFAFSLGYMVHVRRRARARIARALGSRATFSSKKLLIAVCIMTVLVVGGYALMAGGPGRLLFYVLGGRSVESPWDAIANRGTALTPLHIVFSSLAVLSIILSAYMILSRRIGLVAKLICAGIAILILLFISLESGTRSLLLVAVGPPLMLYFRSNFSVDRVKSLSIVPVIALVGVTLIAFASFMRDYRFDAALEKEIGVRIEDNNFLTHTAMAFEVSKREKRLLKESATVFIVTGPIPRALWPGKPTSQELRVFTQYVWGVDIEKTGGNTLPSIVGQYYINWGWYGIVLIGLVLGIVFRLGDDIFLETENDMVRLWVALVLSYVFVSFRHIGFNYFPPIYAFTVLIVLLRLRWSKPRNRAEHRVGTLGADSDDEARV